MRLLLGLVVAIALGGPSSALAQAATTPEARRACASAAFASAEVAGQAFDAFRIVVPYASGPVRGVVDDLRRRIQDGSVLARRAATGYESVIRCGSPTWTLAALVREGQIYARLAWAIRDQAHQFPQYPPQFGQRIVTAMEPQIAPLDCLAIVRYILAVRAARAAGMRTEYTTLALDALAGYELTRVTTCAADQHARDSTFAPFTPGDLRPL